MEEILKYVQNQLVQAPFRLEHYIQNDSGWKYPMRNIFIKIDQYLRNFLNISNSQERWIIIPGLRGVGKTTVLAQLYFKHFQAIGQQRILYISLDDTVNVLNSSLKDALLAYEEILGESFERLTKPVFIFIDESQYDPKWASTLKSLYDRSKKVFIVCSGSSAVSLQTNPDVYRRAIFEKLYPTSFPEFLMIRDNIFPAPGLKQKIKDAIFYSESAEDVYNKLKGLEGTVNGVWAKIDRRHVDEYLKIGTLPFAIAMKNEARVYSTINLLLDKVINDDVQSLGRFDNKTIGTIKRILFLLAESEVVSMQKLAAMLEISINTVSSILEVLEQAELIIRVLPHGSNFKKVRKPSKYLFMSSAMRSSLLSVAGNPQIFATQKGHLMEDIVALTLFREFVAKNRAALSYDSSKGGADFILTIAEKNIIPIEIGISDKSSTQVAATMKKYGSAKYGVVIARNSLALIKEANIIKVPLDYFLLI